MIDVSSLLPSLVSPIQSRVVRDDVTLYTVIEPTNVTLPMCMPGQRIRDTEQYEYACHIIIR